MSSLVPSSCPTKRDQPPTSLSTPELVAPVATPGDVLRMPSLVGSVTRTRTDQPTSQRELCGSAPVKGTADQWVELIDSLAYDGKYGSFVSGPSTATGQTAPLGP